MFALVVAGLVILAVGIFIGPTVRAAIAKELGGVKAEFDKQVAVIKADADSRIAAAEGLVTKTVQAAADVKEDLMKQLDVAHTDIATLSAKVVSLVTTPAAVVEAAPAVAATPAEAARAFIGMPALVP